MENSKLTVIVGPTASGKSDLAVKLAEKFSGEVVSADSRQVYKGMDIGTGKITRKEMQGIPHHLLSIASPKRRFTVTQYRKLALLAMKKILNKGKTPILCGGTAFYIRAVVDGITIPEVKPDWRLRSNLNKLSAEELFKKLKKLDPRRAKTIDRFNPRRLIRAIEIAVKTKKPIPPLRLRPFGFGGQAYPILIIGIKKEKKELRSLIKKRILKRLKNNKMVDEVKKLKESGLSWKRLEEFGLEYRWITRFLKSDFPKINFRKSDFFNRLQKDSEHFAKKQMLWWKKDKRIKWIKTEKEAEKLVKNFLYSL